MIQCEPEYVWQGGSETRVKMEGKIQYKSPLKSCVQKLFEIETGKRNLSECFNQVKEGKYDHFQITWTVSLLLLGFGTLGLVGGFSGLATASSHGCRSWARSDCADEGNFMSSPYSAGEANRVEVYRTMSSSRDIGRWFVRSMEMSARKMASERDKLAYVG